MKTYTVKIYDDGTKFWYLDDKLHREDGPAVECANGTKHWCLNYDLENGKVTASEWYTSRVDGDSETLDLALDEDNEA